MRTLAILIVLTLTTTLSMVGCETTRIPKPAEARDGLPLFQPLPGEALAAEPAPGPSRSKKSKGAPQPPPPLPAPDELTFSDPQGPARSYTIARGDTLWRISKRHYGSGQRWRDVAAFNGIADPTQLAVGQQIMLP